MSIILSRITSHPLFSSIVTFYILVILYVPHGLLLKILLSPVFIITGTLLISLLRLGAIQKSQTERKEKISIAEETEFPQEESKWVECKRGPESEIKLRFDFDLNPSFKERFVEWDVGAPLEVIYEENEREEEDEANKNDSCWNTDRYPLLSLYYSESDTDSSSETDFLASWDWGSPEKMGCMWEEEDKDGLIEIALEKKDLDFHGEEENLIEIDISSPRGLGLINVN
ncbi:hypothetical protein SLE2022_013570 [Rubroshorea leprosula]